MGWDGFLSSVTEHMVLQVTFYHETFIQNSGLRMHLPRHCGERSHHNFSNLKLDQMICCIVHSHTKNNTGLNRLKSNIERFYSNESTTTLMSVLTFLLTNPFSGVERNSGTRSISLERSA